MSTNDWRSTLANLGKKNKVSAKIALDDELKAKLKGLVQDQAPEPESAPAKKQQKFFAPGTKKATPSGENKTSSQKKGKGQALGNDLSALAQLRANLAQSEKENSAPIRQAGFGGYKLGSKKKATEPSSTAPSSAEEKSPRPATPKEKAANSAPVATVGAIKQAVSQANPRKITDNPIAHKLQALVTKSPESSTYVGMSAPKNASQAQATRVADPQFAESNEEESAVLRQLDALAAKKRKVQAHKEQQQELEQELEQEQELETASTKQNVKTKNSVSRAPNFKVNLQANKICLELLAKSNLTLSQEEYILRQLRLAGQKQQEQLQPQHITAFLQALGVSQLQDFFPTWLGQEEKNAKVSQAITSLNASQGQKQLLEKLVQLTLEGFKSYFQRQASVPNVISYTPDLPVSNQIDLIRKLLRHNQVIVVAGDTGSGKTTQIPKLCLELGFSKHGYIGHTQPRRIAASSVAKRIADELETQLGDLVGYKVRFNEQVSPNTHIKLMTDGILLAEMQNDPLLKQYSCLIIDEAHERSLNNDFILGYLKLILARRPDLKVIITSATIDVHRFSRHFNNCPIVEVAGRTYPVEVRYRPLTLDEFVSDSSAFAEEDSSYSAQSRTYSFGEVENSFASAFKEASSSTKVNEETSTNANASGTTNASGAEIANSSTAVTSQERAEETAHASATPEATPASSALGQPANLPPRGTSIGRSRRHSNLAADETFGLSTVNPYASDNDSHSAFSRRIYSDKSPKPEELAAKQSQEASLRSSQAEAEEKLKQASSQPNLAEQEFSASQEQASGFAYPQYQARHGFGTSDKDAKAFKAYRKYADDEDSSLELSQGVIAASEELLQEGHGDILVFLSGEREIRDVANELSQHFTHVNRRYPGLKVLPLYSRLSSTEQQLIFKPDGNLRIILATNIAETSLTVPGIKYVIDAGTARISRYNYKTQVQGLPIEAISQASANQRKGRCGRTSPGICIRLYSEADFYSRPEFTDPEIKRTNLSAVILKMLSLNLPHIEDFPFLDAPERSFIRSGLRLLEQLQAIYVTPNGYAINKLGKQLAELPVDPRLGRMILEASHLGSLNEMLILAAGMTVVDVRERPQGKTEHAQQLHAEYKDKNSDYMTLLNLWHFLFAEKMSNTQFRKFCKRRYINYLRVREWQDLYSQLKLVALQLKLKMNQLPANYPEIHRAMLPGLLDHIAQIDSADKMQYRGARGKAFRFFNTSVLYKQRKSWVMVSEMLHLNQTYAMLGASIEPSWVEPYARHLLKYAYQQPHWSKRRGEVCAYMSANLFGLTIVDKRLVSYGKIDPETSRQIFIRQALVEQNWDQDFEFYLHNNTLLAQALKVEEQQRKRGLIISEEDLYAWYAARIPAHVNNNVSFTRWWEKQSKKDPHYLDIDLEQILNPEQALTRFPEYIQDQNWKLKLNYLFEPESPWDGVNVLIPIQFLQGLDYRLYQWHIANYREELVETLIRNLPKNLRKQLIPAPDYARVFCERIDHVLQEKGKVLSFYQVLAQTFKQINGSYIEASIWQEAANNLPAHLQVHFTVLDLEGQVMAQSNDLAQLQQDLQHTSQELVNSKSKQDLSRAKVYTDFEFTNFGQMQQLKKGGVLLDSYPALVPVLSLEPEKQKALARQMQAVQEELGNSDLVQNHIAAGVIIQNLATASEQARVMHAGLRDLLLLNSQNPIKFLQEKLPNKAKLAMYFSGNVSKIIAECIRSAADHIMRTYEAQAQELSRKQGNKSEPFIWDKSYYLFMLDKMRSEINADTYKVAQLVEQILVLANSINKELKKPKDLEVMLGANDIKQQLATLTRPDFVAEHSLEQLSQVPRYLEAILYRLERMGQNPALDQKRQEEVNHWEQVYQQLAQNWPVYRDPQALTDLFFMIQEFRVSLFAQTIGSRIPVSSKRIEQYVEQLKENVI
ncbi:ATP-dependent RNA helicase HrpA [Psittacicella melopsittaci]|uniref:ATP-dependent RNA helicase HrpA n=1 Tax=Psittacicella melopsittaci TaxID=2028576 RepID=A0A3A1Y9K7_9GAMM|nr:ATP-dependent RNA helicase HrpA [Psittacicella melopsittaci]RIY33900.1 ATP-dependent RNA helicase HrpA [Psittacicella melopsittaci]